MASVPWPSVPAAGAGSRGPALPWTVVGSIIAGVLGGIGVALPWITAGTPSFGVSLTLWQAGQLSSYQELVTGSSSTEEFYGVLGVAAVAVVLLIVLPLVLGGRPRSAGVASAVVGACGLVLAGGFFLYLTESLHGTPGGTGFVLTMAAFLLAIVCGAAGMRNRLGMPAEPRPVRAGSPW